MNTRFRFRIWDTVAEDFRGNLKKYYIDSHTGELVVHAYSDLYEDWYLTNEDGFIVQQWTGLTDKNGIDVFEGDICRWLWSPSKIEYEGEVYFDKGIFKFSRSWSFHTADDNFILSSLEVIGNIFKNPELIP